MTQFFFEPTSSPTPSDILSTPNTFEMPQVPCALCLDAANKPTYYDPNVSSLTGHAPHPTDLVKPNIQGEFFCVTAGRQVGIVSNKLV
jgi:hypothetical protein